VVTLFWRPISRVVTIGLRQNLAIPVLMLLLAALSLNMNFPRVKAQSTDIVDVSYPQHVMFDLERRTADPPLLVKSVVSYSDTEAGYSLVVSIFDLDSGDTVMGTVSGVPEPCDTSPPYAACLARIAPPSGIQYVQFLIAGFRPIMSLALIAVLFDTNGSLFYESESDYEFAITMTSSLVLNLKVPSVVSVSVDGVSQPDGSVSLNLIPAVHRISVPDIALFDNSTRLKFEHWSDGINETNRTIQLSYGTTLAAIYAKQYLLNATSSQENATGTGWYAEGSNATYSIPSSTLPMEGVMGWLGGKWNFQAWYEDEKSLTTSPNGSIVMLQPHSFVARFEPDYSLPALVFTIVALSAIIISRRIQRRGASRKKRIKRK
jgi:hypothetical protein